MRIAMTTGMPSVEEFLLREAQKVADKTIRMLSRLGDDCINEARDRSPEASWYDHSGCLRSSVGYVITRNGNIINMSNFRVVKQGSEGQRKGKEYASWLAKHSTDNFALIIVAGMPYASEVEAMNNKVVLASAELMAREKLPGYLQRLAQKLNEDIIG